MSADQYTSGTDGSTETSRELPSEVATCLENSRFLHLATCQNNIPHVSLMNYTYLASTPFSNGPTVIMTTLPASHKTADLSANPNVSLVVHDWSSHRPPTLAPSNSSSGQEADAQSPTQRRGRSSLANLLFGLNSAAMSRISVSLNGRAELLSSGTAEEKWCKAKHKEHNTFDESSGNGGGGLLGGSGTGQQEDGGATRYIEGQDIRVIVVKITGGRISDWKGTVKDWVLAEPADSGEGLVNGV